MGDYRAPPPPGHRRRGIRRLGIVLLALALSALAATWYDGRTHAWVHFWAPGTRQHSVWLTNGRIGWVSADFAQSDAAVTLWQAKQPLGWNWWFTIQTGPVRSCWVPLWAIAALVLVPLGRLVQIEWRARFPRGRCQKCGYDLARLPASSPVCPECGEALAASMDG